MVADQAHGFAAVRGEGGRSADACRSVDSSEMPRNYALSIPIAVADQAYGLAAVRGEVGNGAVFCLPYSAHIPVSSRAHRGSGPGAWACRSTWRTRLRRRLRRRRPRLHGGSGGSVWVLTSLLSAGSGSSETYRHQHQEDVNQSRCF